ncbi:myosin-2 heavy chain [Fopius arisanus]|uniref:Myosin-2 heavy chain n=1 Tax=Fopius arisanus TaxID=64838 RepID=A0A9R1TE05_9HYME|nr:PREDICTED: myosin-2 heavy chain [Fopius arisanus]
MPQASGIGPRGDASRVTQKKGTGVPTSGRNISKFNRIQVVTKYNRVPLHRPPVKHSFRTTRISTTGVATCPSTFRPPIASSCRKSLSMIDLSPAKIDVNFHIRPEAGGQSGMGQVGERSSDAQRVDGKTDNEDDGIIKSAGSLVCHALALNAWRRRREEVAELSGTIEKLSQQVDHLQLQIVVLRRLLETENNRVAKLSTEVHGARAQLEDEVKQKGEIIAEKEMAETEVKKFQQISDSREVLAENLRNELLSVKDQLSILATQMSKEREKILKLREDKKILLEKVSGSEALAIEHEERVEKIREDLQERLGVQVGIIDTLQGDKQKLTRALKVAEMEKIRLEKRLSSSEKSGKALGLRVNDLEMQLGDREAALRRIETAYNAQLIELNDLRERLLRQSHESGWSTRVLQIAGSVVRAPRAILRSLSFLSATP